MPPERTLTDADIAALSEAISKNQHSACNLGLTSEEVTLLKKFLKATGAAANIVGTVVLTAIVGAVIVAFTKGFWLSLAAGIKDAGK